MQKNEFSRDFFSFLQNPHFLHCNTFRNVYLSSRESFSYLVRFSGSVYRIFNLKTLHLFIVSVPPKYFVSERKNLGPISLFLGGGGNEYWDKLNVHWLVCNTLCN